MKSMNSEFSPHSRKIVTTKQSRNGLAALMTSFSLAQVKEITNAYGRLSIGRKILYLIIKEEVEIVEFS